MAELRIPIKDDQIILLLADVNNKGITLRFLKSKLVGNYKHHLITYNYILHRVNNLNIFMIGCLTVDSITRRSTSSQFLIFSNKTQATAVMDFLISRSKEVLEHRPKYGSMFNTRKQ